MSPALFAIEVDSITGKDVRVMYVSYPAVENIVSRMKYLINASTGREGYAHKGEDRQKDTLAVLARGNKIDIRIGSAPLIK